MTNLAPPARCDGCGEETSGTVEHVVEADGDECRFVYCNGCESIRELRGIEPGDHDQYKLLETND